MGCWQAGREGVWEQLVLLDLLKSLHKYRGFLNQMKLEKVYPKPEKKSSDLKLQSSYIH